MNRTCRAWWPTAAQQRQAVLALLFAQTQESRIRSAPSACVQWRPAARQWAEKHKRIGQHTCTGRQTTSRCIGMEKRGERQTSHQTHSDTHTKRERYRQRYRQTETETDKDRDRQTDRERERERDTHTQKHTDNVDLCVLDFPRCGGAQAQKRLLRVRYFERLAGNASAASVSTSAVSGAANAAPVLSTLWACESVSDATGAGPSLSKSVCSLCLVSCSTSSGDARTWANTKGGTGEEAAARHTTHE